MGAAMPAEQSTAKTHRIRIDVRVDPARVSASRQASTQACCTRPMSRRSGRYRSQVCFWLAPNGQSRNQRRNPMPHHAAAPRATPN